MKKLYTKLMNGFLMWLATSVFRSKTRILFNSGNKYLLRVYIKKTGKLPGIYLHRFYDSDHDRFLHDHPWADAVSIILTGRYKEEKLQKDMKTIVTRDFYPGKVNIIKFGEFHRVNLADEPIWTFFITWNRNKTWGFWDIENQKFIPWDEYRQDNGNYILDLDGKVRQLYE
jgi:hypothetical protein